MDEICAYCGEPIGDIIRRVATPQPMHRECLFRGVAGSVAHIERRCGCYVPGSIEGDPPGMTLRQGAIAAFQAFERAHRAELRNCKQFPSYGHPN
jgi:hypothetical protein